MSSGDTSKSTSDSDGRRALGNSTKGPGSLISGFISTVTNNAASFSMSHQQFMNERAKREKQERFELLRDVKNSTQSVFELYSNKEILLQRGDIKSISLTEKDLPVKDLIWNIEKCLWHGLKVSVNQSKTQTKQIPVSFWTFVNYLNDESTILEERDDEMKTAIFVAYQTIVESTTCSSDVARSRVWIRCALNSKCLSSSLQLLFYSKRCAPVLQALYEPWSILRDDESLTLFVSMLGGLSGVDFTLDLDGSIFEHQDPPPRRSLEFSLTEKSISDTIVKNSENLIEAVLSKADKEKTYDVQSDIKQANVLRTKVSSTNPSGNTSASNSSSDPTPTKVAAGAIASVIQSSFFGSAMKSLIGTASAASSSASTSTASNAKPASSSFFPSLWGSSSTISKTPDPFGKPLSILIKSPSTCAAALLDWEIGVPDICVRCISILMTDTVIKIPDLFTNSQMDQDASFIVVLKDSFVNLGSEGLPHPWRNIVKGAGSRSQTSSKKEDHPNPFAVVALLKLFLRQLPEPLIPFDSYDAFVACHEIANSEDRNRNLKCLVETLDPTHLPTLCMIASMLHYAGSPEVHNDWFAVAASFSPSVLRPRPWSNSNGKGGDPNEQSSRSFGKPREAAEVFGILVENYDEIFSQVELNLERKRSILAGKVATAFRIHREIHEPINTTAHPEQEKILKKIWEYLTPSNEEELKIKINKIRTYKNKKNASLTSAEKPIEESNKIENNESTTSEQQNELDQQEQQDADLQRHESDEESKQDIGISTSSASTGSQTGSDKKEENQNNGGDEIEGEVIGADIEGEESHMDNDDDIDLDIDEETLLELEEALKAPFGTVSVGWRLRGFQTSNSLIDLRGGGVAGLRDLAYFVEHFNEKAKMIVSRSFSLSKSQSKFYPFAQAAVQMSNVTSELLGFSVPQIDLQKLATEQAWHILGESEASHKVFSMTFLLMDAEWVTSGEDVMAFNRVKLDTKAAMAELLTTRPRTVEGLWDLWIDKKRSRLELIHENQVMENGNDRDSEKTISSSKRNDEKDDSALNTNEKGKVSGRKRKENEQDIDITGDELSKVSDVIGADTSGTPVNIGKEKEEEEIEKSKLLSNALPKCVGNPSKIFDQALHAKSIESVLPTAFQGYNYEVLFSSVKHGENIELLYSACKKSSGNILVVEDLDGNIFGGFSTVPWEIHTGYYGTGESFLFSFYQDERGFKSYPWTEKNNYFQFSTEDGIGMGGGGDGFGIYLDSDLKQGTTDKCDTFGNDLLTPKSEFVCKYVEVWTFTSRL